MRRLATGLVLLAFLIPAAVPATTAISLSDRIVVDGLLEDYAPDEWVLDPSTAFPERSGDSRWGGDREILRVAVTWDRTYLYLAVEFTARDAQTAVFLANRAGGLVSLEDAGEFRRAIDLTGMAVNVWALASPAREPRVARADDSHPFALVDEAAVPAAVRASSDGHGALELAVPWSMLDLAGAVRLVAAITGDEGEGAGDAAPDPSGVLDPGRHARAVLDRHLRFDADLDDDGTADEGVSPRAGAVVEPNTDAALPRPDGGLTVAVAPRAFAPDRGESVEVSFGTVALEQAYVTCAVYSMDGSRVRTLFSDALRTRAGAGFTPDPRDRWDGRDEAGRVVRGGAYVVAVEWGLARGERSGRAAAPVVVVR